MPQGLARVGHIDDRTENRSFDALAVQATLAVIDQRRAIPTKRLSSRHGDRASRNVSESVTSQAVRSSNGRFRPFPENGWVSFSRPMDFRCGPSPQSDSPCSLRPYSAKPHENPIQVARFT